MKIKIKYIEEIKNNTRFYGIVVDDGEEFYVLPHVEDILIVLSEYLNYEITNDEESTHVITTKDE